MIVKWTETKPLHSIPEMYWGEDLNQLDKNYEGEVLHIDRGFFSTILVVACNDGKLREVNVNDVTII